MADEKRILVIEDEPEIVRGLTHALEFEGFQVTSASTAASGATKAIEWKPDCIILDLMLPDNNGYWVCETLRSQGVLSPIVMLTAKGQESDKVRGLEAGADDYMTKPFSVAELIARLNAIFRRQSQYDTHVQEFSIGDWNVNLQKHTLTNGKQVKRLTFYELELLRLLKDNAGEALSREEIYEKVWGGQVAPNNRTVDNFVVKLRKKLEDHQKNPRYILTVYGFGYKFVP